MSLNISSATTSIQQSLSCHDLNKPLVLPLHPTTAAKPLHRCCHHALQHYYLPPPSRSLNGWNLWKYNASGLYPACWIVSDWITAREEQWQWVIRCILDCVNTGSELYVACWIFWIGWCVQKYNGRGLYAACFIVLDCTASTEELW